MKNIKSQKGFTLIELVVVIAILGILAGIAIPRFMDATASARGARIVADLRTIDSAAMLYQAKTGNLPGSEADLTTDASANSKYVLLAAWPAPATGKAIITNNKNTALTWTVTTDKYVLKDGRGTINSKNVDDLLTATEGGSL